MSDRLQKILAHAGVASRRAAEKLISEGRVRVNGVVVTELGVRADSHHDRIEVDEKRIVLEKPAYYVLHKPREMVSTLSDPEGREHIGSILKAMPERVYPVGRLDYHTSGVLLVSNDGGLTDALLHPTKRVPKIYHAKVRGFLDVPELDRLRNGIELDDGYVTRKAELFVLREEKNSTWIQVTLHEGKNRQIHRMMEAISHPVQRLIRVSFAGLTAEGLRPGEYRELKKRELEKLKRDYLTPARKKKAELAEAESEAQSAPPRAAPRASERRKGGQKR